MARENRTAADDAAILDAQLYAGMVQGGFQAHAGVDPCEQLARLEEAAADNSAEERMVRVEAFYRMMEYFFADGWEPVALSRRVYCVAREVFPELIEGVPGVDVREVCDDESGTGRFEVVYRRLIQNWDKGGRLLKWFTLTEDFKAGDEVDLPGQDVVLTRVTNAMAMIYSGCANTDLDLAVGHVSLVGLRRVEGDEEWDGVRMEIFSELMKMFFSDGADAMKVVRRVYVIAKALKPSLIARMSLEKMAWMCGDGGRATQDARVKRCYNSLVQLLSGSSCVKASFQKSASASEVYRSAQQGNSNRRYKFKGKGKR